MLQLPKCQVLLQAYILLLGMNGTPVLGFALCPVLNIDQQQYCGATEFCGRHYMISMACLLPASSTRGATCMKQHFLARFTHAGWSVYLCDFACENHRVDSDCAAPALLLLLFGRTTDDEH